MTDSKRRSRSFTRAGSAHYGLYGTRRRWYRQARRCVSLGFISSFALRVFFNRFQRENIGYRKHGNKSAIFFFFTNILFYRMVNVRTDGIRSSEVLDVRSTLGGISLVTSATISMGFFFFLILVTRSGLISPRVVYKALEINDVVFTCL